MADTDSFIEEVTEEVRRDRLFKLFRKYGWIAVLAVLLLVGGATWREIAKSRHEAAAQATGDAIIAAFRMESPSERAAALAEISAAEPGAGAMVALLTASADLEAGEAARAAAQLEAVALDPETPARLRDLAVLKRVMIDPSLSPADRLIALQAISAPGAPFRLLAEEQAALAEIEAGDREAALLRLQAIVADQETSAGLRRRASDMIVALGGSS